MSYTSSDETAPPGETIDRIGCGRAVAPVPADIAAALEVRVRGEPLGRVADLLPTAPEVDAAEERLATAQVEDGDRSGAGDDRDLAEALLMRVEIDMTPTHAGNWTYTVSGGDRNGVLI